MLLTNESDEVIKKSFQELGTRPQVSTQVIKFLNSNSTKALISKGVKNNHNGYWGWKDFYKKEFVADSSEQMPNGDEKHWLFHK